MKRSTGKILGSSFVALSLLLATGASAQLTVEPSIPEDASEEQLVAAIRRITTPLASEGPAEVQTLLRLTQQRWVVAYADALLQRFPQTAFKDDAVMAKLAALGELARTQPTYLAQLLELTGEIAQGKPSRKLAAENAYFIIQAFVLFARLEEMPEETRLLGTRERYEAFLEDFPESPRRPVVFASLVHNLIGMKRFGDARRQFAKLRSEFPGHQATLHAQGEVFRVSPSDKPFLFTYVASNGKVVRAEDYRGKVLALRFVPFTDPGRAEELGQLIAFYAAHHDKGLEIVEIAMPRPVGEKESGAETAAPPWPRFVDERGLKNEALMTIGVFRVPCLYIIDRVGVLRAIDEDGHEVKALKPLFPEDSDKPSSPDKESTPP